MTGISYPNIKSLINIVLTKSTAFQTLKECRQKFIINVLLCFSSIKGRANIKTQRNSSNNCMHQKIFLFLWRQTKKTA